MYGGQAMNQNQQIIIVIMLRQRMLKHMLQFRISLDRPSSEKIKIRLVWILGHADLPRYMDISKGNENLGWLGKI